MDLVRKLGGRGVSKEVERLACVGSVSLRQSDDGATMHPGVIMFTFTLLGGELLPLIL